MKKTLKNKNKKETSIDENFFKNLREESWTYIRTVVDVLREPVVILDKDLRVMAANGAFYRLFKVEENDTEGKIVYDLGNGQWDIPSLRKVLEDILPKNTFFHGFEVAHEFPIIGRKVMLLNARQIYLKEDSVSKSLPPIILLAIEDVTKMMDVAEMLSDHTNKFEKTMSDRTENLESQLKKLEKEIKYLKNR